MAVQLPQIPYKTPLVDKNGMVTDPWSKFFRQLFQRVGGLSALSNTELAGDVNVSSIQTLTTEINTLEAEIDGVKQGPLP